MAGLTGLQAGVQQARLQTAAGLRQAAELQARVVPGPAAQLAPPAPPIEGGVTESGMDVILPGIPSLMVTALAAGLQPGWVPLLGKAHMAVQDAQGQVTLLPAMVVLDARQVSPPLSPVVAHNAEGGAAGVACGAAAAGTAVQRSAGSTMQQQQQQQHPGSPQQQVRQPSLSPWRAGATQVQVHPGVGAGNEAATSRSKTQLKSHPLSED